MFWKALGSKPCKQCGKPVPGIRRKDRKAFYYPNRCKNCQRKPTIEERFWRNIKLPNNRNECWPWVGHSGPDRYGRLYSPSKHNHYIFAHRFSYQLHKGEIPIKKIIMHICDNPPCVNPDHLICGTPADNTKDMMIKGRHKTPYGDDHGSHTHPESVVRGSKNGLSKLIEQQVLNIRQLNQKGYSQKYIAKVYKLHQTTIHYIIARKTWTHI